MRLETHVRALMLCASILGILVCRAAGSDADYEITKLADGVYAFAWKATEISPEPNILIVINDDHVLVVDSSMFPSTARTIISEIRKLTPKPVRYLVNTHWHDDHVFGNAEFKDAWPDIQIIGHPNTRIDAAEQAFGAIKEDIENNREILVKYEKAFRTGTLEDGRTLTEDRRARVESIVAAYRRYVKEIPTVRTVLPNVTVTDRLTLYAGSRTIDVRYLGRGNTRGDLVVYLPKERILATGDLVVAPTPFGIGSYYAEWKDTLEKLQTLDASTLFLAHGAVQHDWSYVARLRRLLDDLVTRVAAEIARGGTLEQVQQNVTLEDWKKELSAGDEVRQRAFDAYFVKPAVERQYRLAKGEAS